MGMTLYPTTYTPVFFIIYTLLSPLDLGLPIAIIFMLYVLMSLCYSLHEYEFEVQPNVWCSIEDLVKIVHSHWLHPIQLHHASWTT